MSAPLNTSEVLSFQSLGIDPKFATMSNSVLSNDKYLCIREVSDTDAQVVIIDLERNNSVTRHKMKADAAVMNPARNIIALRGAGAMQVFDLVAKNRISSYSLPENVSVLHWCWIDNNTLAFVAGPTVYHWNVTRNENPQPIFSLNQSLMNGSIMRYGVSADGKWCALAALLKEGEETVGKTQFFSLERNASQLIDAFAFDFTQVQGTPVLVFASKERGSMKLSIFPLGASQLSKNFTELPVAPEFAGSDFPMHVSISAKYSTAFVFTRHGFLHLVEITTAAAYLSARVSQLPAIQTTSTSSGAVLCLTRDGALTKYAVNDATVVDYISTRRGNPQAASKIASSAGLSLSSDFLNQQFEQLLSMGNYQEAARVAAQSQNSSLRTMITIQKIMRMQAMPNSPAPILQYFSALLDATTLNEIESIELCRIVLNQGKSSLIEKWITDNKLTLTEELGDLCKSYDSKIALAIYLRCSCSPKVVGTFAELGSIDSIQQYCQRFNYTPNWLEIISMVVRTSPDKCDNLLSHVANNGQPLADPKAVVEMLMQFQLIKQATGFLLDVLVADREEDSELQTMLFEIALTHSPKIAEELFARECFSYYNRKHIAGLCERALNFQRALEHYTDLPSIKRCIVNTQNISQDFLIQYFGKMSVEWALDCLKELLINNPRQNVQLVVQIASTYYNDLGIDTLVRMFQQNNCNDGIFFFLAQVVNTSDDPDVHFKYIESAAKLANYPEVERMCSESNYLQPERVRDFLMQEDLPDRVPLIVLCNRFDFIDELTKFLYKRNYLRDLETYVQKYNPTKAGAVIGALIDIDAPNEFITKLINSVQHTASIDELIRHTMKRERLKLLQPILEARAQSGSIDPATNNGIVLLAILSNRNPEKILRENQYYDAKFVGEVLSKRDAHLACIAFARGGCDTQLIELTNVHQLYKEQARYLVNRQDPDLWANVLSPDNEHMQQVVDAVISTALPECEDPEKVGQTVQAFMDANIPTQLLGLLEKIVLESPQFANNSSLQNLLILTAITSETSRVMTYVTRLSDYNWEVICDKLIKAQLYEEAIAAYKKFEANVEAVHVMLEYSKDLTGAADWASHCNTPAVWSEVATAQLEAGYVTEAIQCFLKAKDPKHYAAVIEAAKAKDEYKALVTYLQMVRQLDNKDPTIETELCYAYARCDMLAELEVLLSEPHTARPREIGQRCFDEKLFKAAKVLFSAIKDYALLCDTLLELKEFQAAVEAARKASSSNTWKSVNRACVLNGDFKLAQQAGLQIVIEADQLDGIISLYESHGYFSQIISLLETALPLERAHIGVFTGLAVLYAKYQPEKTMEHLKQYWQRIGLFKVIKQLNLMHMWAELTFAYEKYNEFDNAVNIMMEHPTVAWTHKYFKELIAQVNNPDICYRALNFYLQYSPLELNDILSVLGSKVDATRVVEIFRRSNSLQLVKSWLVSVQATNVLAVNAAVNEMYIEDGDYDGLRRSIETYDVFDHIALARQLQNHPSIEFRRVASHLYRLAERFDEAIEVALADSLYKDAIEFAAESKDPKYAEDHLRYFIKNNEFECFAATTFVCYDLISPDVVLELAWRNDCMDFAMPYLIQNMKDQTSAIAKLTSELADVKEKLHEAKQQAPAASASNAGFPASTTGGFPDAPQTGSASGFASFPAPMNNFPSNGGSPSFPSNGGFPSANGGFPSSNEFPAFPSNSGGFPSF